MISGFERNPKQFLMMRICRVCLSGEENEMFQPILQENYKTSMELFYVCGIVVRNQVILEISRS